MPELTVAAIHIDAQVGEVEANLAHATMMLEQGAARDTQFVVLPDLSNTECETSEGDLSLRKPLDGPAGTLIVDMTRLVRCQSDADHQSN